LHCGVGGYDPERYNTCYDCFQKRRSDFMSCIWCGRWHSPNYSTCFQCRSKTPDRDEAGRDLRIEILMRDDFGCCYCGATEGQLQIDHIKPCAHGGTADPWNLQVLCGECNRWKGASWSTRSRHWDARVDLMRQYLVFWWAFLTTWQQAELLAEARSIEASGYGARFGVHSRVGERPSASVCADCDTGSTSTAGVCVMCRRSGGPQDPPDGLAGVAGDSGDVGLPHPVGVGLDDGGGECGPGAVHRGLGASIRPGGAFQVRGHAHHYAANRRGHHTPPR
jgi:hypothetical protein